jgi:hypothetical protein
MDQDTIVQILGAFLLGDDSEDIGEFDRLHHWQLGALMLAFPTLRDSFLKKDASFP